MSNNKVIGFRSPQQKSITTDMYSYIGQYMFGDVAKRGATVSVSLLYADTPEKVSETMEIMPMVYTLSAPTGFGKSAMSLEPLRWLLANSLGMCSPEDREFPEETKKLIMDTFELTEQDFYDRLYAGSHMPHNWRTPEVVENFLSNYSTDSGVIPYPLSNGAVAAVVRTRSQTQAFLREAERLKAQAIALPSKASLCLTGKVASIDSEQIDKIVFGGKVPEETIRQHALNTIIMTTQTNAPNDFFSTDPNIIRLASRCSDRCSQCPMNLKYAHAQLEEAVHREEKSGVKADNLMIHTQYGLPSTEDYVKSISEFQMLTKDMEESEILIRQKHPNLCPYPTVRDALPEFNFIILTYPYVFNPQIASSMYDYLQHVEHILIDEAHNIQTMFQTLSSHVLLGEQYYTKVNQAIIPYEAELDILRKKSPEQRNELFARSMANSNVVENIDTVVSAYAKLKGVTLTDRNRTYFLHRALMEENATMSNLSKDAVFQLKDYLDPVVYYFLCFFANVQTRYIQYWESLWKRFPQENQIPNGLEVTPVDVLNILFGEFEGSFRNTVMDESDGVARPYPIIAHANMNKCAKFRPTLGHMPTFVNYFKQLKTWYYGNVLTVLNESNSVDVRRASKILRGIVESLYEKAESIMKLTGTLVNNNPVEMANWRVYQQISNNDFEKIFLDGSIGLLTSEERQSFKNYYLSDSIDYDMLNFMVEKYGVNGFDQHQSQLFKQECQDFLAKSNSDDDMDVEDAYKIFNDLRINCPEAPIHEMPMLKYEGHFPPYMWKLYYRYWDDTFHICPLTLGRLLASSFGSYKTVGLLSGTFQDPKYLSTFWGVTPYEFTVTETVGTKIVHVYKGLSSKFAEREASYPRYAELAKQMYETQCKKNMLVAAPSTEFMKTLIRHMEQIIDPNLLWPNSRILKGDLPADSDGTIVLEVNDMLEAVKAASESGVKKIFITVMGSRFTEGVEYVDEEGKSMLDTIQICGIPFPAPDIFNDDQQGYSSEVLGLDQRGAFELIQVHAAFQKIRQTIGRGIRSNKDHLFVALADNRFDTPFWREHIPADSVLVAPAPMPKQVVQSSPPPAYDTMDFDDDIPF